MALPLQPLALPSLRHILNTTTSPTKPPISTHKLEITFQPPYLSLASTALLFAVIFYLGREFCLRLTMRFMMHHTHLHVIRVAEGDGLDENVNLRGAAVPMGQGNAGPGERVRRRGRGGEGEEERVRRR